MSHYSIDRILAASPTITCVDESTLRNGKCRWTNATRARAIVEGVALELSIANVGEVAEAMGCDRRTTEYRVEKYWLRGMTETERGEILDRMRDAMDAGKLQEEAA